MARTVITIDEKIERAEAAVVAVKKKYDSALDELEKLLTTRKQIQDKKILEAYHSSDRSLDEILSFLNGGNE